MIILNLNAIVPLNPPNVELDLDWGSYPSITFRPLVYRGGVAIAAVCNFIFWMYALYSGAVLWGSAFWSGVRIDVLRDLATGAKFIRGPPYKLPYGGFSRSTIILQTVVGNVASPEDFSHV